ncbi:MAG: RNase adapter RapZ [Alphaproteobacteria bacterium]
MARTQEQEENESSRLASGRVVVVTGMSGAGKTSVLKALEDLGYEAVDNLPLALFASLVEARPAAHRPLAIGVDIRTRGFDVPTFSSHVAALRAHVELDVRLLFVDCDDEILRRRFTATRRVHPMAADRPVTHGIERERTLIQPLRGLADVVLDTTSLTPGALKAQLDGHFALNSRPAFLATVMSFSYGYGLPREADLVFDVRFLANPHYDPELGSLDGRDARVGAFVARDPAFADFFASLHGLIEPLLPRFEAEGKSYLTLAIGCTGGRHRSVFVAERLAAWLGTKGLRVNLVHRDIDRVG